MPKVKITKPAPDAQMTGSALRIDTDLLDLAAAAGPAKHPVETGPRGRQTAGRPASAHLIADLEQCDLRLFVPDKQSIDSLAERVSVELTRAGLREVGRQYHYFGPAAVTASVCLSESHFNFHTWPEFGYVSLDLLCCIGHGSKSGSPADEAALANRTTDRLEKLLSVFATEIFFAANVKRSIVLR